ncbi:hypothetical protein MHF_1294 [Mycoplasma haemofelis Ohio2]|uniref:Uncharacterized protein n=1 Tax=Mycoplasma haemofelis (strain Ohio2) TaxID=859194 RepID=F6FG32_MYCHI|nr:hypothetical protein MHF_1294 [Mycoplasma haemofelis Ohio2]
MEKNASDLDTIALSSGTLPSEKMFWDYCLAGNYELSQLSKK